MQWHHWKHCIESIEIKTTLTLSLFLTLISNLNKFQMGQRQFVWVITLSPLAQCCTVASAEIRMEGSNSWNASTVKEGEAIPAKEVTEGGRCFPPCPGFWYSLKKLLNVQKFLKLMKKKKEKENKCVAKNSFYVWNCKYFCTQQKWLGASDAFNL